MLSELISDSATRIAGPAATRGCGFGGDGCALCWWSLARRRFSSEASPMPSARGWFGGGLSRLEGRATHAPAHPAPLARGIANALPSLPSPPQGRRSRAAERAAASPPKPRAFEMGTRGFGRRGRLWAKRRGRIWFARREAEGGFGWSPRIWVSQVFFWGGAGGSTLSACRKKQLLSLDIFFNALGSGF